MATKGVRPSYIFNETGYILASNGDIRDSDGNVVRRRNNDSSINERTAPAVQGAGETETAVSSNDGRGVSDVSGENAGTVFQRRWSDLSEGERQSVTDAIIELERYSKNGASFN